MGQSEIQFKNIEDYRRRNERAWDYEPELAISANVTYPVTLELEKRISAMEGGARTVAVPTGQAAIISPFLACAKAGSHVLLPDTAYGPLRSFVENQLKAFGVETSYYLDAGDLEERIRPSTALVYIESPGSSTFEIQDIAAIAKIAAKRGIVSAMDNTWSTPLFCNPLKHGVDIVVHSLSKLMSGGAVFAGAVTVRNDDLYKKVKNAAVHFGHWLSPQDAETVMKGIDTLPQRLARQVATRDSILAFLEKRSEVVVLNAPSHASSPFHALWKKYYTGAAPLFSIALDPSFTQKQMDTFVDALKHFKLASGWGGAQSFVITSSPTRSLKPAPKNLLRLYVGAESADVLIPDLENAFRAMKSA